MKPVRCYKYIFLLCTSYYTMDSNATISYAWDKQINVSFIKIKT